MKKSMVVDEKQRLLFDGVCNLCDGGVRLYEKEKSQDLKFAPCNQIMERHYLKNMATRQTIWRAWS